MNAVVLILDAELGERESGYEATPESELEQVAAFTIRTLSVPGRPCQLHVRDKGVHVPSMWSVSRFRVGCNAGVVQNAGFLADRPGVVSGL
jgi:hypothetical protein